MELSKKNVNVPTSQCPPPFISYLCFNRLGLTARNLKRILSGLEDFEMHIIDCNSSDNSWDFIDSLKDTRIKSKTRFSLNFGPIYPVNLNLVRRKPNQYFFVVDSDVYIKTENWISAFMRVFDAFPEVGMLGVPRDFPYPRHIPPAIPKFSGELSYLQLKNAAIDATMDFIPGHLQCLRPELISQTGFWSEENGYGDAELSPRVVHYTTYTAGFITSVEIDMIQQLDCSECTVQTICKLDRSDETCFSIAAKLNKNKIFADRFKWKHIETAKEMAQGKRTAFCGSIHDPKSLANCLYHQDWASENFSFYIENGNP